MVRILRIILKQIFFSSFLLLVFLCSVLNAADCNANIDSKSNSMEGSLLMTDNDDEQKISSVKENRLLADPSSEKQCAYCNLAMPIAANVCSKCGRDQRWWLNYFRTGDFLLMISLIISFFMVLFTYKNLQEAKNKSEKADQALERALGAEEKVKEGLQQLQMEIGRSREEAEIVRTDVISIKPEITGENKEL